MAHFAQLSDDNVVLRVIAVNNAECLCDQGTEDEAVGQSFCVAHFGGRWVQTSYNSNFRKRYAGVGFTYDEQRDAFIPPKPYASWLLDEATCDWVPPWPKPAGGPYAWSEETVGWVAVAMPA